MAQKEQVQDLSRCKTWRYLLIWNKRDVILDFEVSGACFVAHELHFAISRVFLLSLNFINRQNGWKKWTDPMFDLQWVLLYSGKRLAFIFSAPLQRSFPHFPSFQLF